MVVAASTCWRGASEHTGVYGPSVDESVTPWGQSVKQTERRWEELACGEGDHAGKWETSIYLALNPDAVRLDAIRDESTGKAGHYRPGCPQSHLARVRHGSTGAGGGLSLQSGCAGVSRSGPFHQEHQEPHMTTIDLQNDQLRLAVDPQVGAGILAFHGCIGDRWLPLMPDAREPGCDLAAASFLMIPYSNRIADGAFRFDGQHYSWTTRRAMPSTATHASVRGASSSRTPPICAASSPRRNTITSTGPGPLSRRRPTNCAMTRCTWR